jgi:integrase
MDETFRAGHGKTEKIPARSNFSLSADLNACASIGDVPVDPEILEILRGFHARAKSPFVVTSSRAPRRTTTYEHYRCEPVFDRVLFSLKAHGVRGHKPLHALRKEYGALIHEKYDLITAKELLRHSSVAVTAAHYVENRKRGTTGLGALLKGSADNVIELDKKSRDAKHG